MSERKFRFVSSEPDRHGNERYYFRKRGQPRVRVRHPIGSPEFVEAYDAFVRGDLGNEKLLSAVTKVKRSAYVYCLGSQTGPFKVGIAQDPSARLMSIQIGNPRALALMRLYETRTMQEAYEIETGAHRLLESLALKGEWFAATLGAIHAAVTDSARVLGHPIREIALKRKMNICVALKNGSESESVAPVDMTT